MKATTSPHYDQVYYDNIRDYSLRSAIAMVPIVLGMLPVRSVVDVGCGDGTWLKIFSENGVEDSLGIDGDYVDPTTLRIPTGQFLGRDLSRPFSLPRKFDLVVTLEVAEHLPGPSAVEFVRSLTALGDHVLFSAAVPQQGGANHINEQWPQYWAELFGQFGFQPVDCVRPRIWRHPDIAWWYAQNTILYLGPGASPAALALASIPANKGLSPLPLVHPGMFRTRLQMFEEQLNSPRALLRSLPRAIRSAFTRRLSAGFGLHEA